MCGYPSVVGPSIHPFGRMSVRPSVHLDVCVLVRLDVCVSVFVVRLLVCVVMFQSKCTEKMFLLTDLIPDFDGDAIVKFSRYQKHLTPLFTPRHLA